MGISLFGLARGLQAGSQSLMDDEAKKKKDAQAAQMFAMQVAAQKRAEQSATDDAERQRVSTLMGFQQGGYKPFDAAAETNKQVGGTLQAIQEDTVTPAQSGGDSFVPLAMMSAMANAKPAEVPQDAIEYGGKQYVKAAPSLQEKKFAADQSQDAFRQAIDLARLRQSGDAAAGAREDRRLSREQMAQTRAQQVDTRTAMETQRMAKMRTDAEVKLKIPELEDTAAAIDAAMASVKANPKSFGWMRGLPGTDRDIPIVGDPQGVGDRATVAGLGAAIFHQLSGAAISPAEFNRLKPYIPGSSDSPDAIASKLANLKREYSGILARKKARVGGIAGTTAPIVTMAESGDREAAYQAGKRGGE